MKCTECNKRLATLHFTKFVHGTKQELHLCQTCAINNEEAAIEESYTLHELLTGLFNFDANKVSLDMQKINEIENKKLVCSNCDLSFQEFRRIGKFGCSECYASFESKLIPILKRVHSGNTKHYGKIPKRSEGLFFQELELKNYRKKLESLIIDEKFEEAAVIRDRIKEIEKATNGE